MKKENVLSKILSSYQSNLKYIEYKEFKKEIQLFIDENREMPDLDFYKKFEEQFTRLHLLNSSSILSQLSKISSNLSTIRIIIVIYLVASIIGAIAFLLS